MKFIKGARYQVNAIGGTFDVTFKRKHPEFEGQGIFALKNGEEITMITAGLSDMYVLLERPKQKKTFNMVYCHASDTPPKERITSFKGACKAAERLAKKNPGKKFYVVTSRVRFHVPEGSSEVVYEGW